MDAALFLGIVLVLGGFAALVMGVAQRRPASDGAQWLSEMDEEDVSEYEQLLAVPFLSRVVKPLSAGALERIASVTPSNYLDAVHKKLVLAGMSGTMRAEEFATIQVLTTVGGLLLAVAWTVIGSPASRIGILILVLLPAIGALLPQSWLSRAVTERKESIFRDLPDVLDLLAISVEAGMGFEGALDVVCSNFDSPLALEFSRTLKEMELGLPRRDALQNLKRRTEVPELSNFVLALTQADALGMPVGRVLHTQAAELRTKRRQWAREKAAKLPVKILFPLILFIFPAILIVILGPAGVSIMKGLGN
jgi:tight adherence protein C